MHSVLVALVPAVARRQSVSVTGVIGRVRASRDSVKRGRTRACRLACSHIYSNDRFVLHALFLRRSPATPPLVTL